MITAASIAIVAVGLFLGTFTFAYLPSMLKLNKKAINLISIFGTGAILGACIIIVLPESAAILIQASYEISKLTGEPISADSHDEHSMHGPISTGENQEQLISSKTVNTIGGAIMCGFMLMLMIDEGVSILRQRLLKRKAALLNPPQPNLESEEHDRLIA